jgi:hypothetical protein
VQEEYKGRILFSKDHSNQEELKLQEEAKVNED